MKHLLFTASVYPPEMSLDDNDHRLAATRRFAIPSMRDQYVDQWVVALHPDDPKLAKRRDAFVRSGLHMKFIYLDPLAPPAWRSEASQVLNVPGFREASTNPGYITESWIDTFSRLGTLFDSQIPDGPVLLTRLDDDDGYTSDAMERIQEAATRPDTEGSALIFPEGFIRWEDGLTTTMRHETNWFVTHYRGPERWSTQEHPYSVSHNDIHNYMPVHLIDDDPGWLWYRHNMNVTQVERGEIV